MRAVFTRQFVHICNGGMEPTQIPLDYQLRARAAAARLLRSSCRASWLEKPKAFQTNPS